MHDTDTCQTCNGPGHDFSDIARATRAEMELRELRAVIRQTAIAWQNHADRTGSDTRDLVFGESVAYNNAAHELRTIHAQSFSN